MVVTSSGSSGALPGTEPGSLKVTPYAEYPAKGRATGGVRCHRFLKGEDTLVLAWVGGTPAKASGANGVARGAAAGDRTTGRVRHPGRERHRPDRRPVVTAPPTGRS